MTESKTKHSWGGQRQGAGRPGTNSKLYTFRLPGHLAKIVDEQEHRTEFFRHCIVHTLQSESDALSQLGEVFPATRVKDLTLPFYDIKIVAGFPVPLDNDERSQDIELLTTLCPNPDASYLIRVYGDSMIDAGIHSGDIVIVDKSRRHPREDEVAVCEFNGEYTLKHFVMRGDHGFLVPANSAYPELEVTPDDDFQIWGTVTYVIHKPRE